MSERTAESIRVEREAIHAEIIKLRARAKKLSDELRAVEGPIPDRSHRGPGIQFSIKKAGS